MYPLTIVTLSYRKFAFLSVTDTNTFIYTYIIPTQNEMQNRINCLVLRLLAIKLQPAVEWYTTCFIAIPLCISSVAHTKFATIFSFQFELKRLESL